MPSILRLCSKCKTNSVPWPNWRYCRECSRAKLKEWRQNNKDKVKAAQERWLAKSGYTGPNKKYIYPSRSGVTKEYYQAYYAVEEHQVKRKARQIVNNQIQQGKLKRLCCEVESCILLGEAHHDDYSKPLQIKWLCKQHHEDLHHKTNTI